MSESRPTGRPFVTRIILAAWVLALLQHAAWGDSFCGMRGSDYRVVREVVLLPEGHFTRENLIEFLSGYAQFELDGEMYLMATSDRELYRRALLREGRELWSEKPTAYFFRIGSNAFFQYRDAAGQTEWVVLNGENLYVRKFGETRVIFLGENFTHSSSVKNCQKFNRNLEFLVENPSADSLKRATQFYAELFSGWKRLSIWIWEWDIGGVVTSHVEYPNLDYLELFKKKKELVSVYMDQAGELGWVSHFYRRGARSPSTGPYLSIRHNTETLIEKKYNQWSSGWP